MKAYFTKIQWEIKWFWLSEYLKNCKDWHYRIDIVKQYNNRSLEQNAYMWGVVYKMLWEELWYDDLDIIHEIFAEKFLTKKVRLNKDKRVKLVHTLSTAILTTVEFEEYMQNIRFFAQKFLNMKIPLPNEV